MEYKSLTKEENKMNFKKEKRKNQKLKNLFIYFLLLFISIFFLFQITYIASLSLNSEIFKPFQNLSVKIGYSKIRPVISIKLNSKEFKIIHYFGNETDKETDGIFNKFLNKYSTNEENNGNRFSLIKHNDVSLQIRKTSTENSSVQCFEVDIRSLGRYYTEDESVACFKLSPNYWFGGHESYDQPFWPINNQSFEFKPYITGYPDGWAGVLERYWLSSNGIAIFLNEDIPLHVQHLNSDEICLMSDKDLEPYEYTPLVFKDNSLVYQLCYGQDAKTVHTYMIDNFIGRPKFFPDIKMIEVPVWTTWSYYFTHINQSIVLDYAQQIVDHNYPRSNLEIDDKWENLYGDLDFYMESFPDMKTLSTQLHNLGFRVTLWVHPFCNIDAQCFVDGANKGYWVKQLNSDLPGLTTWWNGRYAALLDTTNPNASDYFTNKLDNLKKNYLIDAFKFDAGESFWTPRAFSLFNKTVNPNVYSAEYVRAAATMGNFIEVRVGARTQDVGVFYRLLDRATDWTIHDGIKSVITETLQFSILGYPYVLPDIIYGNGGPDKSKKELFIRWTQLNTFLPAMQFSVPPWYFDNQTDAICLKLVNFRQSGLSSYIVELASRLDGIPIVRPMWWGNDTNENNLVFTINDQFMVGDEIVVAPILDEGVTSRNIYLPGGKWFDPTNNLTTFGPIWLNNYHAPLEIIPFFLLETGILRNSPYFN